MLFSSRVSCLTSSISRVGQQQKHQKRKKKKNINGVAKLSALGFLETFRTLR